MPAPRRLAFCDLCRRFHGIAGCLAATRARTANPKIDVIARAHSDAEVEHLKGLGADTVIMGEREIARGIVEEVMEGGAEPKAAVA